MLEKTDCPRAEVYCLWIESRLAPGDSDGRVDVFVTEVLAYKGSNLDFG
jgi:hypothetical protein